MTGCFVPVEVRVWCCLVSPFFELRFLVIRYLTFCALLCVCGICSNIFYNDLSGVENDPCENRCIVICSSERARIFPIFFFASSTTCESPNRGRHLSEVVRGQRAQGCVPQDHSFNHRKELWPRLPAPGPRGITPPRCRGSISLHL